MTATSTAIFRNSEAHRTSKAAIGFAVEIMCRVADRRKVVNAAQLALNCARLDQFGPHISMNGENALQGWVLDFIPEGRSVRIIDVGAHIGEWSRSVLETAQRRGRIDDIDLHAFEPSGSNFEELVRALGSQAGSLHRVALSDSAGTATLHIQQPGQWGNSFHEVPGLHSSRENIEKTTLDIYARQAGLDRIDILKIDTEGHELAVMRGASGLLQHGCVGVLQFEYNNCWIYARHFLRDAFQLLTPMGYHLGKLTPRGVMLCPSWDASLETFTQAQYVACAKDIAERLPRVEWWNLTTSEQVVGVDQRPIVDEQASLASP